MRLVVCFLITERRSKNVSRTSIYCGRGFCFFYADSALAADCLVPGWASCDQLEGPGADCDGTECEPEFLEGEMGDLIMIASYCGGLADPQEPPVPPAAKGLSGEDRPSTSVMVGVDTGGSGYTSYASGGTVWCVTTFTCLHVEMSTWEPFR